MSAVVCTRQELHIEPDCFSLIAVQFFVLSRVFEGIMDINKIFLWTDFTDILDSKQVLAPGSVFTCSL